MLMVAVTRIRRVPDALRRQVKLRAMLAAMSLFD
jgi:hypothetical protein